MNQILLEELQKKLDTLSAGLECALSALKAYEPQPYWSEATKSLVMRLRGIYAIGPEADQGIGEYGFHKFDNRPPIQLEAAERIAALEAENAEWKKRHADALAAVGVEQSVNAALREDKARLDWVDEHLVTQDWPEVFIYMESGTICQIGSRSDRNEPDYVYGTGIRAAIDAARKGGA